MIDVRPLTPHIGAEISGLDLADDLDDATFSELDKAFMDHKVLFFRDQDITTAQHVAVCRHFGDLEVHPFVPAQGGFPRGRWCSSTTSSTRAPRTSGTAT